MDWLLRETPSSQMEECMAYKRLYPFGDDWDQAAMIGSICSTAATNMKYKNTIPARELIPRSEPRADAMSDEDITKTLNSICSAYGLGGG